MLDADFMVSSSLNELQHSTWLQTAVSQGVLVVLPALEPVRSDAAAQQAVARACQGILTIYKPQTLYTLNYISHVCIET